MKAYTTRDKAKKAAGKRSLFASLNGKFSQYDVIAIDGEFYVVEAGKYPKHTFWTIVQQYCGGYSI
jgi:hypothetical protein